MQAHADIVLADGSMQRGSSSMQRQEQCNAYEESHLRKLIVGMTWNRVAFAGALSGMGPDTDDCLCFCSLAWVA